MYVERIVVNEFRCFQHAEIEFNYPGKLPREGSSRPTLDNVTLLLGNNGTGKSALLRAIAWGALAQVLPGSGLRPFMFVRRDVFATTSPKSCSVDAHVVLHAQDSPGTEVHPGVPLRRVSQGVVQLVQDTERFVSTAVTDQDSWQPIFNEQSPSFFVAGFGATRRSEGLSQLDPGSEKSRSLRYQRVAGIFEDQVALMSTGAALSRILSSPYKDEAIKILGSLLPANVRLALIDQQDGEFLVGNVLLPSTQLSDGYRAFLAWTLDLLANLAIVAGPNMQLSAMEGTVLVDEIDLHLHPSWQRLVVGSVARAFPKLQFIITSHSPLVTGSVEAGNILFAGDTHEFSVAKSGVQGLSSDQILTSPYFGLASPRSVEAVNILSELADRAWSGDQSATFRFLEMLNQGVEGTHT